MARRFLIDSQGGFMQTKKSFLPSVSTNSSDARSKIPRTDVHLLLRRINAERWQDICKQYPPGLFATAFYWVYGEDPIQTTVTIRDHLEATRRERNYPSVTMTFSRVPWVRFSFPEPDTVICVTSARISCCPMRIGGNGCSQYAILLKADIGGEIVSPYEIALSEIDATDQQNYPRIP